MEPMLHACTLLTWWFISDIFLLRDDIIKLLILLLTIRKSYRQNLCQMFITHCILSQIFSCFIFHVKCSDQKLAYLFWWKNYVNNNITVSKYYFKGPNWRLQVQLLRYILLLKTIFHLSCKQLLAHQLLKTW